MGPNGVFRIPVRVYYQDTDAGGVVFHAQYLAFMERARSEFLNALGIDLAAFCEDNGVLFVVHELAVKYHRPARLNQLLTVSAQVSRIGPASLAYRQRVERGAELLVEADVALAVVARAGMRPVRLPRALRRLLPQPMLAAAGPEALPVAENENRTKRGRGA